MPEAAFERAGVTPADIDTINFYDSFTITALLLLEDLGFCPKGEGGKFVQEGHLRCGGDVDWLPCSGRGTVHTFTVIRQNHAKPFKNELPYVVAIVELDEGPRMMGNVTGVDPDDMQIGAAVEVYFVQPTNASAFRSG